MTLSMAAHSACLWGHCSHTTTRHLGWAACQGHTTTCWQLSAALYAPGLSCSTTRGAGCCTICHAAEGLCLSWDLLPRYGPRVRMGIYEGVPTMVCPHSTSGRCDYWGPFVNRAARFGNAAARGGQIMVPSALARSLVTALTKQRLSLEGGEPVLLVQPDFLPQKLKRQTSSPVATPTALHLLMKGRSEEPRVSMEVRSVISIQPNCDHLWRKEAWTQQIGCTCSLIHSCRAAMASCSRSEHHQAGWHVYLSIWVCAPAWSLLSARRCASGRVPTIWVEWGL